eukprot:SAG31_NODE_442_length_15661_cov_4.132245_5_plen_58_part_00
MHVTATTKLGSYVKFVELHIIKADVHAIQTTNQQCSMPTTQQKYDPILLALALCSLS